MTTSASSISLTALALTSLISPALALNPIVGKGCYSSSNGLQFQGTYMYQSQGYCQQQCVNQNKPVMGLTNGGDCWCGDLLPPQDTGTDDSKCSMPCLGFGQQPCMNSNNLYLYWLFANQSIRWWQWRVRRLLNRNSAKCRKCARSEFWQQQ